MHLLLLIPFFCALLPSLAAAVSPAFDPTDPALRPSTPSYQLTPQEERASRVYNRRTGKEEPKLLLDGRYVDQIRQLPPDLQEVELEYVTKHPEYRREHQVTAPPKVTRLQPVTPHTTEIIVPAQLTTERQRWQTSDERLHRTGEQSRVSAFETLPDHELLPLEKRRDQDRISPFDEGTRPIDPALREKMRAASPRLNAFDRPVSDTTRDAFTRGQAWQDPLPNNIARKLNVDPVFTRDDDRINAFSREREYDNGQPSYVDPNPVTVRPFDRTLENGR